jgi:hypothetical protein
MPPITTYTDVLPLRAIVFQLLFMFMAIAIEAAVLNQRLNLGHKVSMQYAATVNLLSTVVGWMVLFAVEPWLPTEARELLIEYVFFGIRSIPSTVIVVGFAMFILTFALKLQGIEFLETLLEKSTKPVPKDFEPGKFRGRKRQTDRMFNNEPNRPLAVLWANAFSFTAIITILAIRILVDQVFAPSLPIS